MFNKVFNVFKVLFLGIILIILTGCEYKNIEDNIKLEENGIQVLNNHYLKEDDENLIELKDLDGKGVNYSFEYNGEDFLATFSYGSWRIFDSYKIRNKKDILKICESLIKIHPVQSRDGISYRTAEDMAYEWIQHNIAYEFLPDSNLWKENAKNVDLDPQDQGKNLKEIFESRIKK